MEGSDDPRARLLEAAGEVFAVKGLDAVGVREIAEKAGTSPAAVNYYFRGKEALYVEAVRYAAAATAARSPVPQFDPGVAAEDRLRAFIVAFLGRFLRDEGPAWQGQLILREVAQPTAGACEHFVEEFVRPTFNALLEILADLVGPEVPRRELQMLGGSVIGQCLHHHHARYIIPLLIGPEEYATYSIEQVASQIHAFPLQPYADCIRVCSEWRSEGG